MACYEVLELVLRKERQFQLHHIAGARAQQGLQGLGDTWWPGDVAAVCKLPFYASAHLFLLMP